MTYYSEFLPEIIFVLPIYHQDLSSKMPSKVRVPLKQAISMFKTTIEVVQ
jgi:hypothetical protein